MRMKYKCFILDDEPLAIKVIEQYLSRLDQFDVAGMSTDPVRAFELLKNTHVDLLFLDIENATNQWSGIGENIESQA